MAICVILVHNKPQLYALSLYPVESDTRSLHLHVYNRSLSCQWRMIGRHWDDSVKGPYKDPYLMYYAIFVWKILDKGDKASNFGCFK